MKGWQIASVAGAFVLLLVVGSVWFFVLRSDGGIGVAAAPAKAKGMLRLATFNVEGLFDAEDDLKLTGANDDVASSEAHLAGIAEAIRVADADIVALQDVESIAALEWFVGAYLEGMGYEYAASLDVGHDRGSENAVISRLPIEASKVWPTLKIGGKHPPTAGDGANPNSGQPMRFRRSPLMVRVEMPDGDGSLTLFVVEHKGGDKFDYWREAEAGSVVGLAKEVGMHERVVVLGSFHCDPGDPSLEAYFAAGFVDALGLDGESSKWASETSGDRTDFILANRVAKGDLDPEAGFVLGGAIAELRQGSMSDATHLPVVIGLRAGDGER